jgi:hypothetical protein
MTRPSTSLAQHKKEDVDARDKRGHDDMELTCDAHPREPVPPH